MIKGGLFGGDFADYNDATQRTALNAFWNSPDRNSFGAADVAAAVANPAQAGPGPMEYVHDAIDQSPPPLSWSPGVSSLANSDPWAGTSPENELAGLSPVELQPAASPEVATSVLGRAINGGTDVGNALRKVPLIGGILGNVGDVGEGAVHLLTGDVSRGVGELAGGVGGLGQIGLADALAAGTGALGKVYMTGVDLANVLSGGTMTMPDRSFAGSNMKDQTGFMGALECFGKDLIVPTYGLYSGANWGSTQWGNHGPFFNLTDDAARVHDAHLNDREWDKNIWSPAPDGVVPDGPIGIANFLVGAIPFWLDNGHDNSDSTVTLTR